MVTAAVVTAVAARSPSPLRLCCRKLARPPTTQGGEAAAFSGRFPGPRCRPASPALPPRSSNSLRSKRMLHFEAAAAAASATATSKGPRGNGGSRGVKVALGAVTTLAAVAALAREAQLPNSFSEWDDQVSISKIFYFEV